MSLFYTHIDTHGDQIFLRYVKDGERKMKYMDFKPTFYVPTNGDKPPEKHTIYGEPVVSIKPGTIREAKQFAKSHDGIAGFELYESDIDAKYQFINKLFGNDEIEYNSADIRICSLDIETTANDGFPSIEDPNDEVIVLTMYDSIKNQYSVLHLYEFDENNLVTDEVREMDNVDFHGFESERDLLIDFIRRWSSAYPDIVTGWNSNFFDLPYLYNRIVKVLGENEVKKLSPIGFVKSRETFVQGKNVQKVHIGGLSLIDYMELYKNFTFVTRESYKLDHIARVELDKQKIDNPYDTFREFYLNDFQKFVEYNVIDVALINDLDESLGLIQLALTIAYLARVNFEDVFSPVKTWDMFVYKYLMQNDMVPPLTQHHEKIDYPGAYVMDPTPGFKSWVASFDLTSMYPSIIMSYNMSPETLMTNTPPDCQGLTYDQLENGEKSLENTSYTMAANGAFFRTDINGVLPVLVKEGFDKRVEAKNKMKKAKKNGNKNEEKIQDTFQMAYKVLLNSLYGASGNVHFRYYFLDIAAGITTTGQHIICYARNRLNKFLEEKGLTNDGVIYMDTDSLYCEFDELVKKQKWDQLSENEIVDKIDSLCSKILEPKFEEWYQELARNVGNPENKIHIEREVIAPRALWISKKRYLAHIKDNEGARYEEPKLKVMGIEAVRSSTPEFCRDKIMEGVDLILYKQKDKLMDFIEKTRKEFKQLDPEKAAYPRGVSDMPKYQAGGESIYVKGTPIANRAALLYNYHIDKNELNNKYERIQSGDKIKFISLKKPNPIHEDVIAFSSKLPPELNLHKYIDYDNQFYGAFLKPLENIVKHVGWSLDNQTDLDDFFS